MRRYELTDEEWDKIKDLIPGRVGYVGKTGRDNRLFLNAVLWIARTGAPWRDLPERYGDWKNTHRRFSRWAKSGVWQRIFEALQMQSDGVVMIDSTINRAHQHASGSKKGANQHVLDVLGEA